RAPPELPDALPRDDRVVEIAEQILKVLRPLDEEAGRLADGRLGELGRGARVLCLDADVVQLLVGGLVWQRVPRPAQALEGVAADVLEGDVGIRDVRLARRLVERREELQVAIAPERREQAAPRPGALALEGPQQAGSALGVARIERGDLIAEVLAQDVEVADGSQLVSEPLELGSQRPRPVRIEHGPRLAQERAGAAARDPPPAGIPP